MHWIKKLITVPATNETKQVESATLWVVEWTSRHGSFYSDTMRQFAAFPSEVAANEFALSLRNAFKLIRTTAENKVTVKEDLT